MALIQDVRENLDFPLPGRVTVLGRDQSCDIVINSSLVSSRHFIILHVHDRYFIEDLDSLNGTFLNGRKISDRTEIQDGDKIEVVGMPLIFKNEREPPRGVQEQSPANTSAAVDFSKGQTIRLADLVSARPVTELSSLAIDGDLRLSIKPEAKLRAVLEIARNLSHSLDLKVVLPQILDSLLGIFPQADCGSILLVNRRTGDLIPGAVKFRGDHDTNAPAFSRAITQQVLQSRKAILSHDVGGDQRFKPTESIRRLEIQTMMCVPISREGGECLGVIHLHSRDRGSQFSEEDLALLVCTSLLAGRAVEVARLHEERRELEAATQIQRSLLPMSRPNIPGLQFYDHYAPAQLVGGDYYDYFQISDSKVAMAVGDVAGKGLAASLLMAHLAAAARVSFAEMTTLSDAVRRLNLLLTRQDFGGRFITFTVAVVDVETSRLTVVNAGHQPPLLRRGMTGETMLIAAESSGLPLGVRDCPYEQIETTLEPGDTVLFYTDGVSEMRNPTGELYGDDRVEKTLQASPGNAAQIGQALLDDVKRFAGTRPPADDVTVLCVSRISTDT